MAISGGTVTAIGGKMGAGIGGGHNAGGGEVTITGGTVTANGGKLAAGIGGGYEGRGCDVTITGGTVIAKAGEQGGTENRAIGLGKQLLNIGTLIYGTLNFGDAMMVGAGNDGAVERIYDADERVNACWHHSYAEISPCTHPGATYTVEGTDANGTHTLHCSHCAKAIVDETHDFDENGECTLCHFKGTVHTVTIYLPDANNDDTYEEDGRYKTYQYNMVAGTTFTLPGAPQDLYDMEFAGWLVTTGTVSSFSTYKTYIGEMLLPEKTEYTLNGDVTFVARYKDIAIILADGSDNTEKLYNYDEKKATSVLCLPFSLSAEQIAASLLFDADIRTLSSASFKDGTLTLNFTAKNEVTSITAGTPYIVKWEPTTPNFVSNLIFNNVTISNTYNPVETEVVDFVGTYAPVSFTEEGDNTVLYLGADNLLYYPSGAMTIGAQRAFFQLNGLTAGPASSGSLIKAFNLNFGEETGIREISESSEYSENSENSDYYYSLDGRRIGDKPVTKGIYIHNGQKVMIK